MGEVKKKVMSKSRRSKRKSESMGEGGRRELGKKVEKRKEG